MGRRLSRFLGEVADLDQLGIERDACVGQRTDFGDCAIPLPGFRTLVGNRSSGNMPSMMVSIDRAGRVVIPKELRDRLAITEHTELEIEADDGGIRLTPVRIRRRVILDGDGLPVIESAPGITITDADVQRWRDAGQR